MTDKNRIRFFRKKLGISQDILAETLGYAKSKVSKLENGEQALTHEWMRRLSRAFKAHGLIVAPAELLPLEDMPAIMKEMEDLKESAIKEVEFAIYVAKQRQSQEKGD